MIIKWWITRAGDYMDVEGNFLDTVEAHPSFFAAVVNNEIVEITSSDIRFAKEHGIKGQEALFDKICWDLEDKDGKVVQPGAIFIEQKAVGLVIGWWRESYKAYKRIINWLSSQNFLGNTQVILCEVGTQRKWRTDVRTLLADPYAKNPDRRGNCPRCNSQISWDEIVERGVCPKCKEKLT